MKKDSLEQIEELLELRGNPELLESWHRLKPFLRERQGELPKQFFDLSAWKDTSESISLMLEIMKSFSGNLPVDDIAQRTAKAVHEKLGFGIVLVSILDTRTGQFIKIGHKGIPKRKFRQMVKSPIPADFYDKFMQPRFQISQSYLVRWWHPDSEVQDDISYTAPTKGDTEWHTNDILLVPICDHSGTIIGMISVDNPPGGKIPHKNVIMTLEILSAEAGKAIDESRNYEKTERRLAQMELLYEISISAGGIEEKSEFIKQVCYRICRRFQYLWSGALLTDSDDGMLHITAQSDQQNPRFPDMRKKIGREGGIAGIVAASGQYRIIGNINEIPGKYTPFHPDALSQLAVPIRKRDKVLGVIVIESEHAGIFTQEDRRFFRTIANQVASALSNLSIVRARNEELRIRRALFEIGTVLSSILEPERLMRKIMDTLRNNFNYTSAALFLIDENNPPKKLVLNAFAGRMDREVGLFEIEIGKEGVVGFAASTRKTINVPDVSSFLNYVPGFLEAKSELAVPIIYHGNILGILDVESKKINAFSEHDERLLELFASEIAVALKNAQLYKQLEALATKDGLTGLYNYRAFMEALKREVHRGSRLQHSFGLLFADLDFFKQYNDRFGHPQGDLVLKLFADIVRANIRADVDVAARYGGEEFAVILPETACRRARNVADRIRKAFAKQSEIELLRPVTVSFGVSCFPEHDTDPESLLRKVDRALYRAKSIGRNRTCMTSSPKQKS